MRREYARVGHASVNTETVWQRIENVEISPEEIMHLLRTCSTLRKSLAEAVKGNPAWDLLLIENPELMRLVDWVLSGRRFEDYR